MNWTKAISKMIRQCNHWQIFRLSITGRVMVVKTYLLSQCIYLMNTIPLSAAMGERINEIMINYVRGGDRAIARGQVYG